MAVFGFTLIVACLLVARSAVASDLPNVTVSLKPLSNPKEQIDMPYNADAWVRLHRTCPMYTPP